MAEDKSGITTQKLLETIGLQTVQLSVYQSSNVQLQAENQRLTQELKAERTATAVAPT